MPSDSLLHERDDFKALVETVAESEKINDPALVEKDYWIMHTVFGLKQLGLKFELKGGTSLSKGFGIIQRFSEDIDIRIEPFDGLQVDTNPNHEKPQHVESRRQFFDKLRDKISIPGIVAVERDTAYDDVPLRNAGLRLRYETKFASSLWTMTLQKVEPLLLRMKTSESNSRVNTRKPHRSTIAAKFPFPRSSPESSVTLRVSSGLPA